MHNSKAARLVVLREDSVLTGVHRPDINRPDDAPGDGRRSFLRL
jgi:hypothetical protein